MAAVYTANRPTLRISAVACVVAAASFGARAAGEDAAAPSTDPVARARALFLEGVGLADTGDHEGAAARFREALGLHPAPAILYNLAATLDHLDRDLEAAEQLDLLLANADTPADLQARAEALLLAVERQVGRLRIGRGQVDWAAEVSVDGQVLEAESFDVSFRVAAGAHTVVATEGREELFSREVAVGPGQTVDVTITDDRPEGATGTPLDVDRATAPSRGRRLARDWRLWVGVGAGVIAIALGVGLGVGLGDPEPVLEDPVRGNMSPGVLTWP
jgi:hypothetical protein